MAVLDCRFRLKARQANDKIPVEFYPKPLKTNRIRLLEPIEAII